MAKKWMGFAAVPPKEAIEYLRGLIPVTKAQWQAMDEASKARAFFVAGLAKVEMVAAVRDSLVTALESGQTLETWREGILGRFEKNAWQPLKPHHLNTIFGSNVQAAYMAGQWAQLQRNKRFFPYLRYDAVNDSRTRPVHRALDGLIFPIDHPFWDQWLPPNGFGCRCGVVGLTEGQVRSRGLKVETEMPRDVETEQGLVSLIPEPGFGVNVGKQWLSSLSPSPTPSPSAAGAKTLRPVTALPAEKSSDGETPSGVRRRICREGDAAFAAGDDPCAPALANLDARHILPVAASDILARGLDPAVYARAFLAGFGVDDLDGAKIITVPGAIMPVVIGKGLFTDNRTGAWLGEMPISPYVRMVARTFLDPYEVWLVPGDGSKDSPPIFRLIRLFATTDARQAGLVMINLIRSKRWGASAFFVSRNGDEWSRLVRNLENRRVGTLVYREP